ncbi:virulence effector SrfC [Citrobacter cronae]|uniref:virulence factor SrfC family protein n=1 Tax=Citrobacter freundii complex TaxID=1344959 RepID=UPI000B41DEBA|nr:MULTISPECIES: virulence factor SrfC family protein [Citrobacter]MCU6183764.1 virulence effector SrfC [Citrobacter cronae]RNW26094.1 virulence effector SrfC [Citrobacter werkmanii]
MSKMLNTAQAVIEWVTETRQRSVRLDDEADALLTQLTLAAVNESALTATFSARGCVGLYGHSQSAKAHLLAALCSNANGKVNIVTPDRSFDYFSHINPGHAPTNMAIRFTREDNPLNSEWPLRLRLLSEAELVQLFITQFCALPDNRQVEKSIIEARLEKWQTLRQRHPVQGITAQDVAAIGRFWRSCVPANQQQIDDALWHQFATLLPALDLTTRANAWALLWGEQPELTQQWLALAHTLQQTGNAQELAAPLSLLVDHFGLPAESFLTQVALHGSEAQSDVVVHPIENHQLLNAVSLSQASLALLTRELILTVEDAVLENVDLLDIPLAPDAHPHPLWQAKLGWMLEHYRQQLQPDVLLICNAVSTRAQTPAITRKLLGWVNDTQPVHDAALPGVVWAITPQDARFSTQQNLDESVQQLMGKPGLHWGTLQALDNHSLQRLVEWLTQATSPQQRQARLTSLREQHQQRIRETLMSWTNTRNDESGSSESVIRQLQSQAAKHGELLEGLLPPMRLFESLLRVHQPREEQVNGLFNEEIDLFAEVRDIPHSPESKETGYLAHKMWVNHVRQWCRDENNARRLGLDPRTLRQVADILVTTSYRLEMPQRLQRMMQRENVCAAQLHADIGDFITWLGFTNVAEEQRPASRIQKGAAIFSAPKQQPMSRLAKLEEQPSHGASRYVYDWLVALYTRANENVGYQHPQDVNEVDKKRLDALLSC